MDTSSNSSENEIPDKEPAFQTTPGNFIAPRLPRPPRVHPEIEKGVTLPRAGKSPVEEIPVQKDLLEMNPRKKSAPSIFPDVNNVNREEKDDDPSNQDPLTKSKLIMVTNPQELIQVAESTAIQTYKIRMDQLLDQGYFGYIDIRTYHEEVVQNITYALQQTLDNYQLVKMEGDEEDGPHDIQELFVTIITKLEKLFRSQFAVQVNRNEVKIENWIVELKNVTKTAESIFESFVRKGLEKALANGSFKPDYLFNNLVEEGRWKALQSFVENSKCKDNELLERLSEKSLDLKEEYWTRLTSQNPGPQIETLKPTARKPEKESRQRQRQPEETVTPSSSSIPTQVSNVPSSKLIIMMTFSSTLVQRLDFNDNKLSGKSRTKSYPPYIYYSPTAILIGDEAKKCKDLAGFFSIIRTLRDMHSQPNLVIDSVRMTCEEIISRYLEEVKREMTSDNHPSLSECIIIYPNCLTTFQRRRLKMAVNLLGRHSHKIVPLFVPISDSLAFHWNLPDDPHQILLIHYTSKSFDVVVVTFSRSEMRILSYAGSESVDNPQNFLSLHTKLIEITLTHQSTPKLKEPTLNYYYEIILKSLKSAKTDLENIQNVIGIFEANTSPMKPVLQLVVPGKALIEMDESKLFDQHFIQQFERWGQEGNQEEEDGRLHKFSTVDIYPRNFGFIVNKKIHRHLHKKNSPVTNGNVRLEFSYTKMKQGLNDFVLGGQLEKETYRFQGNGHEGTATISILLTPDGLYEVQVMDSNSVVIPLTNTTFPQLAGLTNKINSQS